MSDDIQLLDKLEREVSRIAKRLELDVKPAAHKPKKTESKAAPKPVLEVAKTAIKCQHVNRKGVPCEVESLYPYCAKHRNLKSHAAEMLKLGVKTPHTVKMGAVGGPADESERDD